MNRFLRLPRLVRWVATLAAGILAVLTLWRVAAYVAFRPAEMSVGDSFGIFWLGFRYDLRLVAVLLLPALVLGPWSAFDPFGARFGRRLWTGVYTVAAIALTVVYIFDFLHFRYVSSRLSAASLDLLTDFRTAVRMIWESYPVPALALGLAASAALFAWALRRLQRREAERADTASPAGRRLATGGVLVLALVAVYGRLGQYPLRWSDAFELGGDVAANLALNPVQSSISSLAFRDSGYSLERVDAHRAEIAAYLEVRDTGGERPAFVRRVPAAEPGPRRPRNVVLVICESFSAYKSSMWGNPLDPTPHFAELCRDGLFFDRCFTPHFGTARGVWATVTGIPDVERVKTATRNPAMVDQYTIVSAFREHVPYYFIGGSSSWANIRGLLMNNIRGLRLFEQGSYDAPREDVWGISDRNLFLAAHRELERQDEPFFAIVLTANNHRPYTIPREDLARFTLAQAGPEELRRGGFESLEELNAFRYMDFAIKDFMEAARRSRYFESTLFVFIGDHGIGGDAGDRFPPAWTNRGLTAFHVPLLFYAPGMVEAGRRSSVASMVDVLPTIAGIVGLAHENRALGRDLRRRQAEDEGRSNAAFIIDHFRQSIGVVRGSWYTSRPIGGGEFESVWAEPGQRPSEGAGNPRRLEDGRFAEALHETARYLLLENRKRAPGETGGVR
jgi:phosphoglycerol transferase MdoB-like AlkP superfamily enzyme